MQQSQIYSSAINRHFNGDEMAYGMKRQDLRSMAEAKIEDAALLLRSGRCSSSYYLAGYSIEFALKACIASQMARDVIPDKEFIAKVYQHKLTELVKLAGLEKSRNDLAKSDKEFDANWGITKEWTPESRYEVKQTADAQYLIDAITDNDHGVMQWIKKHW